MTQNGRLTAALTVLGNLIVFVGTMWLVLWWVLLRWIRHIRHLPQPDDERPPFHPTRTDEESMS